MNFLNTTVEGKQVAQASCDSADKQQVDANLKRLVEDPAVLSDIINDLPSDVKQTVMGDKFSIKCKEYFVVLDRQRQGKLEISKFLPALLDLCAGHPVHVMGSPVLIDEVACKEYSDLFDQE